MMSSALEVAVLGIITISCFALGCNLGHEVGRKVERHKVIGSQDYVESLRQIDLAEKKIKLLEKSLKQ
jgi:Cu/Ag efflux protein CusF